MEKLSRREVVQDMITARRKSLEEGVSMESKEKIEEEIASFETELDAIAEAEQEQAALVRIQEATEQAAYFLDNLVIEGFTMRELCVDEPQYQILRIAVQNKLINLAEEHIKNIAEVQADEHTQRLTIQAQLDAANKRIEDNERQFKADLHQSNLERDDFESKLKNATNEIDRLNSQVDDLRKEIAVGARNAYKVIDSEEQGKQLKALADEIKASRIKITAKEYTDYTQIKYRAILMQDLPSEGKVFGDVIEFPSVYVGKYVEVTAAEAEQFRAEHASNQEAVSDSALGNEEVVDVTPEVVFQELPSIEVPTLPAPVAEGSSSDNGQGEVTRKEFEELKHEVTMLAVELKARAILPFNWEAAS